jgi:hypothetical protein
VEKRFLEQDRGYKRLPDVIAELQGSIHVLRTLKPVGAAMARARKFDPYED